MVPSINPHSKILGSVGAGNTPEVQTLHAAIRAITDVQSFSVDLIEPVLVLRYPLYVVRPLIASISCEAYRYPMARSSRLASSPELCSIQHSSRKDGTLERRGNRSVSAHTADTCGSGEINR